MYSMICTCGPQDLDDLPYENLAADLPDEKIKRWWVHKPCGKPRLVWLESIIGDPMLNYFRGGELDSKAYPLSTLLQHQYLMEGYRWTPDVIVSEKTGATARIWVYEDLTDQAIAAIDHELGLEIQRQEERPVPTLEERRKDLGVSRALLAERIGGDMTVAKISRIEKAATSRTKPEEIKLLTDALDQIEASRVQSNPQ